MLEPELILFLKLLPMKPVYVGRPHKHNPMMSCLLTFPKPLASGFFIIYRNSNAGRKVYREKPNNLAALQEFCVVDLCAAEIGDNNLN